jgi:hypothetical protein
VTSPKLRLFPVIQPSSPIDSLSSSRSNTSYGGTTVNSASKVNIFNMYVNQTSIFEDDDEEKKGLREYLKLGKKGGEKCAGGNDSERKRSNSWRLFF